MTSSSLDSGGGPRLAFSSCTQPFWLDVGERLERENGYRLIYWLGGTQLEDDIKARFPDVIWHKGIPARDGLLPKELDEMGLKPAAIDETLLTAMAAHESVVLKMMERFDLCDYFSHQDRVRQYHRILMAMVTVFDHVRPDFVVHATSPHVVCDYIFYALCLLHGVPTVMFERTSLPNRMFPLARFEDGSETIQKSYHAARRKHDDETVQLADDVEEHLAKLSGPYEQVVPVRLQYKLEQAVRKIPAVETGGVATGMASRTVNAGVRAARIITATLLDGGPVATGKRRKAPYEDHNKMGRLEFLSYRLDVRRKWRRLMRCYESLCRPVDPSRPYIYVALQCQPERQACPNGGVFANQGLVVDMLAKLVPKGWHLYVKEHVSQFNDYQRPERGRTESLYRDIAALPNASLVPLSVNSFDLIDNARAVATVSGSVGWEAVVRGRPALLFGHGWYRGCEGVFYTPTVAACRQALATIEDGFRPDRTLVRLFAHVVDRHAIEGYWDPVMGSISGIPEDQNAATIHAAIQGFLPSDRTAETTDR